MTAVTKLLANTVTLSTSNNTVGGARLVRIVNVGATAALITHFDVTANAQVGTYLLLANTDVCIEKMPVDWLTSNNAGNVQAVSIAYRN